VLVHLATALGALAEGILTRRNPPPRRPRPPRLAEVELRLLVVVEADLGVEEPPHLVAEASSGPTLPVDSRVSISASSNWRPATIFQACQSQAWQANFL
jgi:hypothetical protein